MLAHRIRHVKHGKPPSQGVNAAAASDAACLMGTDRKEIADDDGDDDDPESMFSESLPLLFPDETFTFTGAPGETLEYVSPLFKSVTVHVPDQDAAATGNSQFTADEVTHETLRAPEDPVDSRALFAHLLWGGALVICDEIEKTALELRSQAVPCQRLNLERQLWRVENEDVLELGAGVCYSIRGCLALVLGDILKYICSCSLVFESTKALASRLSSVSSAVQTA